MPFAKKRYTKNDLIADLKEINAELKHTGYYLVAESRNGYTGLDLFRGDPATGKHGTCVRNIECGSPRECLEAAGDYRDGELAHNPAPTTANHKSPFGPM